MSNFSAPPLEVRLAGGTMTSLTAIIGFLGNFMLIVVSAKNFASFRKTPFFLITWQMVVGDIMVILAQLVVAVPITFAGFDVFEDAPTFPFVFAFLDSLGYFSNMLFAFVLILNRFFIFCAPPFANSFFFGKRSVLVSLSATWIYAICQTSYTTFSGCIKTFIPHKLYFRPSCRTALSNDVARTLSRFGMYESYAFPGIMFVLYIIVLAKIRYDFRYLSSRLQSTKSKTEMRLLIQSILICGMLQVEVLAFSFLPKIKAAPTTGLYINLFIGLLSILNATTHPLVLFVFNTDVRLGLLGLFKKPTAVEHLSTTYSTRTIPPNRVATRRATLMSI
ncbi:hypothetical protein QR680_006335 [Steinernema hermaphroditum]|uniref:G-protein coupled receptors family 1 profile domain-containing protein n=1 Tax=Steinernema hermaphroditum TaxID=289476 RepID=A0AA39LWY6_9BILA|nr:hypothetical protein QR680_006335 [Steinernema hermaphroditum]